MMYKNTEMLLYNIYLFVILFLKAYLDPVLFFSNKSVNSFTFFHVIIT